MLSKLVLAGFFGRGMFNFKKEGETMSENNYYFPEWPDVWRRVTFGYGRHIQMLKEMAIELEQLTRQGYGDPADGFVSTALQAAEVENAALWEAQKKYNAAGLAQCLERTLQSLRWYVEVDLSWSAVWENYKAEFNEWIRDVRRYLDFGREDPEMFIDYTTYKWTL